MTERVTRRDLGRLGLAVVGLSIAGVAPAAAEVQGTGARPGRGGRPSTVFVAGDSTAATWPASVVPKAGWGQALQVFLDRGAFGVDNKALSGASSKSFVEVGLLDAILTAIKPGDLLVISFGHNDSKTDDRHTDPYTTFHEYLSLYIDGARRRGARPVLVTPVERRRFNAEGHAYASHGEYPQAMKDLAVARRVPLVDLTTLSMSLWDSLGVEATKDYFLWLDAGEAPGFPDGVQDNTHFQAHGAIELARIVVRELVGAHVLHRPSTRNLAKAIADDALAWPETVYTP